MKRINWKNENLNKAASEKQIAYVTSLVEQMKKNAATDTQAEVREFWGLVNVPANLTSWEASGIINTLQGGGPAVTAMLHLAGAIKSKPEKIDSSMSRFGMLAFEEATSYLVGMMKAKGMVK